MQAAGAAVVGVSTDSVKSHCTFAEKLGLEFPLIADEDHEICEAYGVWQKKKRYGKEFMGIVRSTFLIDEKGTISRVWPQVKVDGHVDEVLAAVKRK